MREIEFTMSRPGLVKEGERVNVTEGKLPGSFYYTIEPAVAMSGNFKKQERLNCSDGIVTHIKDTKRGYIVVVEFDEDEIK